MVKRTDLHESPGAQIGRMLAGAQGQAEAAHTRPTGDVVVRDGFDTYWTDEDSAETLSLRSMGRTQAELEAAMAQAEIDLAAAQAALAQAAKDIAASSDRITAAKAAADQAKVDAAAASGKAGTALASANGRNSRITSTDAASGSINPTTGLPLVAGDTWAQWDTTTARNVIGAWAWDGSGWRPETWGNQVLSGLDVNKLTVSGSARLSQAVADRIIASAGYYGLITTDVLTAGTADIGSAIAQKIAAATADIQTARVQNLTSTGATINQAVIKDLAAQIITSGMFRTAASGQRVEVDAFGIRAYSATGDQQLQIGSSGTDNAGNFYWIGTKVAGQGKPGAGIANISVGYGLYFVRSDDATKSGSTVFSGGAGEVTIVTGKNAAGKVSMLTIGPDTAYFTGSNGAYIDLIPRIAQNVNVDNLGAGTYWTRDGCTNLPYGGWGILQIEKTYNPNGSLAATFYTWRDDNRAGMWIKVANANTGKWSGAWRLVAN